MYMEFMDAHVNIYSLLVIFLKKEGTGEVIS